MHTCFLDLEKTHRAPFATIDKKWTDLCVATPQADVRMQLRRHVRRVHRRQSARLRVSARAEAVEDLSPGLRGHLALRAHSGWSNRVSYLQEVSVAFLVDLAACLEPRAYAAGEKIGRRRTLHIVGRQGVGTFLSIALVRINSKRAN